MRIGCGIGIQYSRVLASIDPQAQAHYDRVIADDGIMPAGLLGCNAWFVVVKAVYATTDITTAISAGYDPHHLGAKIGAGAGTTSGQAATKLYSCSGASGDLIQGTDTSMPLLLVKNSSDANYAWFPGISTNYISSTTTYATNDIDIEFSINQRSGTTLNNQQVIGTNVTVPIAININRGLGTIAFEYYVGGWRSCSAPFTLASTNIIRVTRNSTTGAVTFVNNGVTLTTSGAQIAGAFDSPITSLCVGGYTSGFPFEGRINYINCYISGVLNRTFNPASYNAATSQTQWTSTTGEVWTINTGTATTGYKGVLVDRTILQGDRTDDAMECTSAVWPSTSTVYGAAKFFNVIATGTLIDSNTAKSSILRFEGIDVANKYYAYQTTSIGDIDISTLNNKYLFTTSIRNGASSKVQVNSLIPVTGTLSAVASTGIRIFSNRSESAAYFSNENLNTLIVSATANSAGEQSAMDTVIRGFSNNPI